MDPVTPQTGQVPPDAIDHINNVALTGAALARDLMDMFQRFWISDPTTGLTNVRGQSVGLIPGDQGVAAHFPAMQHPDPPKVEK